MYVLLQIHIKIKHDSYTNRFTSTNLYTKYNLSVETIKSMLYYVNGKVITHKKSNYS